MAYKPPPFVDDCHKIAERHGWEQVIIVGIGKKGKFRVSSYGNTTDTRAEAKRVADRINSMMIGPVEMIVCMSSGC